ncbi:MAG: MFS transporter [Chloroflexi bacterium AL-N5]|nr:MFS transporter [Chloroflexi bacterium AL-N5]
MKPPSLWYHSDFLKLWAAQTVSQFGTQITFLGLPLIAITLLEANTFEISVLNAVIWLPTLLFSLFAGVWVDKRRRQPILIVSDLLRVVLLLWVPTALFLDILTLWQLYGIAFAVGICAVFFEIAYASYLPSLVNAEQLVEGNTKLELTNSVARVAGPTLAGGLIAWAGAPFAIILDALSYAGSAVFVMFIKKPEQVSVLGSRVWEKTNPWTDIRQGLHFVFTHSLLRPIAIFGLTANFALAMVEAVFLVYVVRSLGLGPSAIGLIFSAGNIGLLVAILFASTVSRKLGAGVSIITGCCLYSLGIMLVPLAHFAPLAILIAAQAIRSFGIVVYNIHQVSLRQTVTPENLLGRVTATMRFMGMGAMPAGSLFGGALATAVSVAATFWIAAVISCFAVLPMVLSPLLKLRLLTRGNDTF